MLAFVWLLDSSITAIQSLWALVGNEKSHPVDIPARAFILPSTIIDWAPFGWVSLTSYKYLPGFSFAVVQLGTNNFIFPFDEEEGAPVPLTDRNIEPDFI